MSHSHLPKAEQKLLVENYLATRPNGIVHRAISAVVGREPDKSVDQYLTQMSDDKEKLINQFRALLPGAEKKAAKSNEATERSKEIANSWKPMIAREAKYTLPGAVMGANIGHSLVRNVGGDGRVGAAVGALAGGWLGHSVGGVVPSTLQEGKNLARQAAKSPQKENYLRENSESMDWGHIGSAALARAIQSTPAIFNAVVSGNPELKALAATSVAAGAISAVGSGYLDKYHRMVAVNEIDNAKLQLEGAAAEKLRRLRRQVSALEVEVEGDGWHAPKPSASAKSPPPKDKSGKGW